MTDNEITKLIAEAKEGYGNDSILSLKEGDLWWVRVPDHGKVKLLVTKKWNKNDRPTIRTIAFFPSGESGCYDVDLKLHEGQYRSEKGLFIKKEEGVYFGAWLQYEEELKKLKEKDENQ